MPAPAIQLSDFPSNEGIYVGGFSAGDQGGLNVSGAGDVNGDGFDDFLVASEFAADGINRTGAVYLLYGGLGINEIDVSALSPDQGYEVFGANAEDRFGSSVSTAGDFNSDGIDDFIVGAQFGDSGGAFSGQAYVIFGEAGSGSSNVDVESVQFNSGVEIQGGSIFSSTGCSVHSAGDVNGDGIDDIIVGASGDNDGGVNAGATYVIYGFQGESIQAIDLSSITPDSGFQVVGASPEDRAGWSVSTAGDFNGDGLADILIGAPRNDFLAPDAGAVYVVYGTAGSSRQTVDLASLSPSEGIAIFGSADSGLAGRSVSVAGDINGDGFDDIVIGAPYEAASGEYSGAAYVVFGRPNNIEGAVDLADLRGVDGFKITGAPPHAGLGYSVGSVGDVNGDGFDDFAIGAPYSTGGNSYAGATYIIFGHSGDSRLDVDLNDLRSDEGFAVFGAGEEDLSGCSVAGAGDVNGDGVADIVIGAPYRDGQGDKAGGAYIIFGQTPTEGVFRTGSDIGQVIFGGEFEDTICGLGGSDTLEGGAGADEIDGGDGFDLLSFEHANEAVTVSLIAGAGESGDALGDIFRDVEGIIGTGFGDLLIGDGKRNSIRGSEGADTIIGLGGADVLRGGLDEDRIRSGGGSDTISGGQGDDSIDGGAGNDHFLFGLGNDLLFGGSGIDVAAFQGPSSFYLVAEVEGGVWTVTDLRSGEQDFLTEIETVVFDDSSFGLL